jgi:hypothetical protein
MTSILDTHPEAKAYMFNYRFQVGNALRLAGSSRLRIEPERHLEEVRLFLDPAGLVEGIENVAEQVDTNLSLGSHELEAGDVQAIPIVEWQPRDRSSYVRSMGSLSGLTVSIPAGTEIGVSPSPSPDPDEDDLRIRFRHDTDIEVGARGRSALRRYDLRGLRPVLLNGIPLLEVTATQAASLRLHLTSAKTAILGLVGVVSPYRRRGEDALYHVVEVVGDRVVGGASLQIRV